MCLLQLPREFLIIFICIAFRSESEAVGYVTTTRNRILHRGALHQALAMFAAGYHATVVFSDSRSEERKNSHAVMVKRLKIGC